VNGSRKREKGTRFKVCFRLLSLAQTVTQKTDGFGETDPLLLLDELPHFP